MKYWKSLQYAMRRAGQNPTDVEVQDLLNKIDDGSGSGTLNVDDFLGQYKELFKILSNIDLCLVVMKETCKDADMETHFKDSFRAFSKDEDGICT